MITFSHKGDFKKTLNFLQRAKKLNFDDLREYGELGVEALAQATPKDSGRTADSWYYQIVETKNGYAIEFLNSNVVDGVPIAIILQYGHGTGTGGYVQGRDYINPAIRPIFDDIARKVWKEVMEG